jgi:lipopolysaccharide/colanic/teichoic acid biosynthesis glycosyltransferase
MHVDAEKRGLQITVGDDPRISRSGRLLRKYKLDELPQLFNVLLGDMSLVGPRPEVLRYVETYPAEVREKVLSVRPGITDLASIQFKNESALLEGVSDPELVYRTQILPKKLSYCEEYVKNRTFGRDLLIILKTIAAILR